MVNILVFLSINYSSENNTIEYKFRYLTIIRGVFYKI
jgi:hypothetical protein